eukprot:TRINITY_DN11163_c0_g1_i4.p1 TRINITY_DN11163_c0_g1~~TRINITY_DN11163_c0_g1_i4.p1  ORF type:complete len:676 (+),score=127.30 TRINITY_DN11163_c0_g1_i4:69-2096(+)
MDNNIKAAHAIPIPDTPWYKTSRYAIAFWAFFGFVNVYALRVNLSVAAVKMADQYNWSQSEKALVLSAFFYGYIITQIPGGWLATRFGAKKVYGFGVFTTVVGTLVTPIVAGNTPVLLAVRIIEGFGEGVTFPAMHAMWVRWAPPLERSKLATFCYSGSYFGTVLALPISGILAKHDFLGGWPAVFYVFGLLGVLWFIGWMLLTSDTPAKHRWIAPEELEYIESSIASQQSTHVNPPTPWKAMLTSTCVWAIIIMHTCQNWGFYTLLTCLPTYFNDVLRFNIESAGFNAAIPYLALFLVTLAGGQIADYVRSHDLMSTAAIRKLLNSICYILSALFLVLAGYVHQGDNATAVAYLTISVGAGGLSQSGFNINHLDISPRYAGVLMGLTNAAATIPGFVAPTIAGVLAPCALCDKTLVIDGVTYKDTYWQGPNQCPPNSTDITTTTTNIITTAPTTQISSHNSTTDLATSVASSSSPTTASSKSSTALNTTHVPTTAGPSVAYLQSLPGADYNVKSAIDAAVARASPNSSTSTKGKTSTSTSLHSTTTPKRTTTTPSQPTTQSTAPKRPTTTPTHVTTTRAHVTTTTAHVTTTKAHVTTTPGSPSTAPSVDPPAKYGKFTLCHQKTAQSQWQVVFYVSAAIFMFGAVVFIIFAKGTVQPWNDPAFNEESKPLLVQN